VETAAVPQPRIVGWLRSNPRREPVRLRSVSACRERIGPNTLGSSAWPSDPGTHAGATHAPGKPLATVRPSPPARAGRAGGPGPRVRRPGRRPGAGGLLRNPVAGAPGPAALERVPHRLGAASARFAPSWNPKDTTSPCSGRRHTPSGPTDCT
jgi:hypothetical protein